ncbi:MAG: preprotein translocase subunit YajC [Crocinitomicaceae bacterium]|nr:preprotein translocase subunit YajC [Crocinitomicaceae bacterium]
MENAILIVLMILVFYFFMIRPNVKKQKEQKKFRDALSQGDKIVTIGGIHGKVLSVDSSSVLVQSDSSKIRFDKSAIIQSAEDIPQANR